MQMDKTGAVVGTLLAGLMVVVMVHSISAGGLWLVTTPLAAFFGLVGVYGLVTSVKKGGKE